MGCDISISYEQKSGGLWVSVDVPRNKHGDWPLGIRSYRTFRFLGGYYGPMNMAPIVEERGYPEDRDARDLEEACGASWLTVDELISFDYAQCAGDGMGTYRETLGDQFFHDLDLLRKAGVERIVFSFWN